MRDNGFPLTGSRPAAANARPGTSNTRRAIPLDRTQEEPLAEPSDSPLPSGTNHAAAPVASDTATLEPGVVEPGRALALADFAPPSLGAGDKLVRFAYSLGLPASAIHPFRKRAKTRLTATVLPPLPGDAAAGKALRAGHFLIHGFKSAIADTAFSGPRLPPPFERIVHGFRWLRDLESGGTRAQCAQVAERILTTWLAANPKPDPTPAWDVGNVGHRLLNWMVHAPLVLSGQDRAFRARILRTIEETARWLDRRVTGADNRLSEVAGWCGLVATGLIMADSKPRRLYAEAGLVRALGEVVSDDGGVLSRSPICQIEAIELLIALRACYEAVREEPLPQIQTMLTLLVPPLLALLHGDGGLGNWQGSGGISADAIDTLITASGVRTRPLRDARQWGYQRATAGKSVLQFDAGPPPVARHARDG
ncbi:MAG: heparinase, partial [Novosphingobium sp. 35-62-5]